MRPLLTNSMDISRDKKDDLVRKVVRKVTPNSLPRSPGTTEMSSWLSPMPGDWHAMARAFNKVDVFDAWVMWPQAIKYLSDAAKQCQK